MRPLLGMSGDRDEGEGGGKDELAHGVSWYFYPCKSPVM